MTITRAASREERLEALRQRLAENQDGILEAIAAQQRLSLLDVVRCLPIACWTGVGGGHFVDAMQALAEWGELTTIVHTDDVIFEFSGPVPTGRTGHGFYNLRDGQGIGGHLRADRCSDIVFLRRPFMGTDTASVQFFNADGNGMFKVYVGRDESRALRRDQLQRFDALAERLAASEAASA